MRCFCRDAQNSHVPRSSTKFLDMGTGITDAQGRIASSGAGIPAFIGVLDKSVQFILSKHDDVCPGDVFITNDPWHGGVTHLNDLVLAMPVFLDGRLIAWTAKYCPQLGCRRDGPRIAFGTRDRDIPGGSAPAGCQADPGRQNRSGCDGHHHHQQSYARFPFGRCVGCHCRGARGCEKTGGIGQEIWC